MVFMNKIGICEVNLAYNDLDSSSIRDLCKFLENDTWTRV